MIFSEVICTELAFRLTTTWCAQPFYVLVPATGKLNQLFEPLKIYRFHQTQPSIYDCRELHFDQAVIAI
jgi:hypothetical protein